MGKIKIKAGTLLVAAPLLNEPFFNRTVLVVVEHTKNSTLGFVLNKPIDVRIRELVQDFPEGLDSMVYCGGPVQNDMLFFIHSLGELLEDSIRISDGVYWSGRFEQLKALVRAGLVEQHDIRFFIGYSGWDPGQLQEEIEEGTWVVSEMDPNYVFNTKSKMLWQQAMEHKGETFSVLGQMPEPAWN
jgi:putative transcriptional regulator